jgi:hypothetical protein
MRRRSNSGMKCAAALITVLLEGWGYGVAQVPARGHVYIGSVKDAPAWVWQIPKAENKPAAGAPRGVPQLARGRGIILDYDPTTLVGVISGEDGKRWLFRAAEWADPGESPKRGLWVDFVPEVDRGSALLIYSLGPFTAKHLELGRLP